MQPNPILRRLGFADSDRVVILHTDDIGMCHASVDAFAQLWEVGIISSGAVMVPCPWFMYAADFARQHPDADLGVHATITCEWNTYRWGPVSTRDPRSGLVDERGYFYQTTQDAQANGVPSYVEAELQAQVQNALDAGMQPTHLDTHMGTVASLRFIPVYLKVAIQHRLPPLLLRVDEAGWRAVGLDPETARMAAGLTQTLESLGLPLLDHMRGLDLRLHERPLEEAQQALAAVQPGITHFILHPSTDTPELRAIAPDWRARVGNYWAFMQEELRETIRQEGLQVIGYRALQECMPNPADLPTLPF